MKRTLTHLGLATPYGDKDLGQYWPRIWLVAWRHQDITWNNADPSILASYPIQFLWKCVRYYLILKSLIFKTFFIPHTFFHTKYCGTVELTFPVGNRCVVLLCWPGRKRLPWYICWQLAWTRRECELFQTACLPLPSNAKPRVPWNEWRNNE